MSVTYTNTTEIATTPAVIHMASTDVWRLTAPATAGATDVTVTAWRLDDDGDPAQDVTATVITDAEVEDGNVAFTVRALDRGAVYRVYIAEHLGALRRTSSPVIVCDA